MSPRNARAMEASKARHSKDLRAFRPFATVMPRVTSRALPRGSYQGTAGDMSAHYAGGRKDGA